MERITQLIRELEYNFNGNRRYLTIFFITDSPTGIALKEIQESVRVIEKKLSDKGIPYETIDFFKDVVAKGELPVGDTGNSFNEVIDWIKVKARPPHRCLLIYEIDPLLSTWSISSIKAFFEKLLYHDGMRMPVLIISYLAGRFSLPTNQTGQALVIKPPDEEVL